APGSAAHADEPGKPAAGTPSAVALDLQRDAIRQPASRRGHLLRELIRQALLIAARDELSFSTRDRVLGDSLPPKDAQALVLNLSGSVDQDRDYGVYLTRRQGDEFAPLTELKFTRPDGRYLETLIGKTESLSTGEFVTVLKNAGCSGKPREFVPEGPVSP